jgi:hypothetical protein
MSINPAIWRKASRLSDPRLLLSRLSGSAKALVAGPLLAVAFLMCARAPWADAFVQIRARSAEREALAPLLREAKRESLTFPQVVVAHPAHLGKVVYWEVTVQSRDSSYAEGRPAWPIAWTNPDRAQSELMWYPTAVLARVAAVRDDVVYLDYLGRP